MKQFEPIYFTVPSGKTMRPRTLHKGGGGDGGAADRKKKEDKRIAAGIQKVNEVFGMANPTPDAVNKDNYYKNVSNANIPGGEKLGIFQSGYNRNSHGVLSGMFNQGGSNQTRVFDEAGYNAALAAAQAKADSLKGAGQAREDLYSKIGADTSNTALLDLNKERGITERELNFALARNGLSGGSRDIDANKDVLDTYQQGVLKSSNLGLQTANNARSNDEKTRVNLINSITAGLTEGDAVTQAYTGMANNARSAQDEANSASLAGFFDVLRNQQERSQYNAGVNSAPQATPYAARTSSKANSTYGGTIR